MALLEVKDLKVYFYQEQYIMAIRNVNFKINKGEIIGIVGESGCGKSVTSNAITRLLDETENAVCDGEIIFDGENILEFNSKQLQNYRKHDVSMIFQNPLTSLDPLYTIRDQLKEALILSNNDSSDEKIEELLVRCQIKNAKNVMKLYPHELSGGMLQRVMIALAISKKPKLLIADEPTTALDVTTQKEILKLFRQISEEFGISILFITHDLGIVEQLTDRVYVMYLGQIVESAETKKLFENAQHPYTQGLFKSSPRYFNRPKEKLYTIKGNVENLKNLYPGCPFKNRCDRFINKCDGKYPEMIEVEKNHFVRCFNIGDIDE